MTSAVTVSAAQPLESYAYRYNPVPFNEDDIDCHTPLAPSASNSDSPLTSAATHHPSVLHSRSNRLLLLGSMAATAVLVLVLLSWQSPSSIILHPWRLVQSLLLVLSPSSFVDFATAVASRPAPYNTSLLTTAALQRRHVDLLVLSMSSARPINASSAAEPLPSFRSLFPLITPPFAAGGTQCSPQPTAVLLLSSPTTHITGVYSAVANVNDSCTLRFLSIVCGPIQQAIELGTSVDHHTPIVRVDGVRLLPAKVNVWPLLNRGNLTMATITNGTKTSLVLGLHLSYKQAQEAFDYHLRIEMPAALDSSAALIAASSPPPFIAVTLHVASTVSYAVGAWVDSEQRAEYVLPPTSSIVQRYAPLDNTTAPLEPNIGLNVTALRLEGLSMFASPLAPFHTLPIASVSLQPLLPTSPTYSIPRIIHQTWFGPRIPPWLWINSWRRDYLQRYDGWLHLLWRNGSVAHLELLDQYVWSSESTFNGHSDVSRTAMTRAYGGMYIDADSLSLGIRPLDELYAAANDTGFFIAREKETSVLYAAGVYGTQPHHAVMRLFQWHQHNNTVADRTTMPWKRIGPGAVTQALTDCQRPTSQPCHYTEVHWRKFFPVYWAGQPFSLVIDAARYPDSLMWQFGFSTNGINEEKHEKLINGRRRVRRLM